MGTGVLRKGCVSEPSRIKADFSEPHFFSRGDRVREVRVWTLIGLTALSGLTAQTIGVEGGEE